MSFNVPIASIPPLPTPSDWVRPTDWIAITDTPNEVQFLVADTGAKAFTIRTTFTRVTAGDNIYIDWGDGVIDTITTTTNIDTSHVYSTGGTPCSRGYNTFKIRVYGNATSVITNARHLANFAVTGGGAYYNVGLLEAYFGDGTCETSAFDANYFTSINSVAGYSNYQYLEYVKLPSTVSWTSELGSMFQNCTNLAVVILPTSASSLITLANTFTGCSSLLDISLPANATGIASMVNTFSSCGNLRTVSLPTSLNSCTTFISAFTGCLSLRNITLPSINLAVDLSNLFSNCNSLQWVKFTSLPSPVSAGTSVTLTNTFASCLSLQNVWFPSSCSTNAIYTVDTTFSGCYNLKNLVFPVNFNASTINAAFSTCYSLKNVVFQSPMPSLSVMNNAFTGCSFLSSVTLPSTVSAGISLAGAFTNCFSLESLTIPSAWNITSLASAFIGCSSIKSIVLPNNPQNSCTSMLSMCNYCYKLETIVLPTSLNTLISLSSTFNGCYRLTSVTLPATMNAVTTMASCFINCYDLTSVVLPTSMSSCSGFTSAFQNCYNIRNIIMPATVSSATTSYGLLTGFCTSLETLTLPVTQTTAVTTIAQMFTGCANLTIINNLNKVGSLTNTPLVTATMTSGAGCWANRLQSLSFSCPMGIITIQGSSATTNFMKLNSLRFLNTSAGQWTGSSPQINISYSDMSTAALNTLFSDLAAQGTTTAKTINITGCTGAAGLTPANRAVITSIGWTIIG